MKTKDLREDGRIILAHGEVTGHAHEVVTQATGLPPDMAGAQWFEADGHRELVVLEPCLLTHQEHDHVELTPDGSAVRIEGRTGARTAHAYPATIRQGDVLLMPMAPGVWRHVQQREQYTPGEWSRVPD